MTSESEPYVAFTGHADILASYAAWRMEWHLAWRRYDAAGLKHATEMRELLARALREEACNL